MKRRNRKKDLDSNVRCSSMLAEGEPARSISFSFCDSERAALHFLIHSNTLKHKETPWEVRTLKHRFCRVLYVLKYSSSHLENSTIGLLCIGLYFFISFSFRNADLTKLLKSRPKYAAIILHEKFDFQLFQIDFFTRFSVCCLAASLQPW